MKSHMISNLCMTLRVPVQADVCNKIAQELGFDLKNGRLDVSVHPFTGGQRLSKASNQCEIDCKDISTESPSLLLNKS